MKIICNNTGKEFVRQYDMETKYNLKKYIGKIFKSKTCGKWACVGVGGIGNNRSKLYILDNIKTGTVKLYAGGQIKNGYMRDEFYPRIYGVGYIGSVDNPSSNFLYSIWEGMLNRCYNKNHKHYNYYGEKGVSVCKDWFNFTTFQREVKLLNGYNKDKIINHKLHLDKDKLQEQLSYDEMEYSKYTCLWLSPRDNCNVGRDNKIKKIKTKNIKRKNTKSNKSNKSKNKPKISNNKIGDNQGLFCMYRDDLNLYHYNQKEICDMFDMSTTCVSRCLLNNWRKHKGFSFKYVKTFPKEWTIDNCSEKCIEVYNEYLKNTD